MSNGTNDWWLKKLLKMDRALVEQRTEIQTLRTDLENMRLTADAIQRRRSEENAELLNRIKQMSPERQFQVVWNGPGYVEFNIDAVSSSHGVTTITVNRADSKAVAAITAKIRARS